tara:strand:- start:1053 stop:1484 length:432 start_codon:yes stop_codon:yes gene_type:complete
MEFKWYLIKCKLEDHAYLPRMVSNIEFTYALHEETENNKFLVKSQVIVALPRPTSIKDYVPFAKTMNFEETVYKWGMDKIKEHENEVKLEEDKMKRMINDMMSRQDLEEGATITEETVWGHGLIGDSGKTKAQYIDPNTTSLN